MVGLAFPVGLSLLKVEAVYSSYFINTIVFSIPAILYFLYNFEKNFHARESRVIIPASFFIALCSYLYYIYLTFGSDIAFNFLSGNYTYIVEKQAVYPLSLVFFFGNLWSILLILRKLSIKYKENLFSYLFLLIATIIPTLISLMVVLVSRGKLPWTIYHIAIANLAGIGGYIYMIVYLNNPSVPSSFSQKMTGTFMVATMILFSAFSFIFYKNQMEALLEKVNSEVNFARVYIEEKKMYSSNIAYIKRANGSYLYTTQKRSFQNQIQLVNNDRLTFSYTSFKDVDSFFIEKIFNYHNEKYKIGFSYMDYRRKIHDSTFLFFIIMLLANLGFFTILPVLYRFNFLNRLQVLVTAVGEVNNGNLDIKIPVRIKDEIGFLARSFNYMIISLKNLIREKEKLIEIKHELNLAEKIQRASLPKKHPDHERINIHTSYIPMSEIGGDFYDFHHKKDKIGILIADVSGHGIPASIGTSMVKSSFYNEYKKMSSPIRLISGMNENLCRLLNHAFVTAAYLHIDFSSKRYLYTNAGHPPGYLIRKKSAEVMEIFSRGACMGVRPGYKYNQMKLDLQVGDRIILYTDGILESRNAENELFGEERLLKFITNHHRQRADIFVDLLTETLRDWSGKRSFEDDFTILVIDIS